MTAGRPHGRARRATVVLCVLAGLATSLALPAAAGSKATGRPDVKVALWGPGGCPALGDSLPPLVVMENAEPGDASRLVQVCVRNAGSAAGQLTLSVLDRADVEVDCSAGEAQVDPTCGAGQAGEMTASVYQLAAVLDRCGSLHKTPTMVDLGRLDSAPRLVRRKLAPGQTACVALALGYAPIGSVSATASQTDRVTWRYALDLAG